jgi:ATP-dependent exoDNAse (exonuclease V) alpha subunit
MITSNIDIDDGLVNGAVGTLKYIEWYDDATDNGLRVKRVWLHLQPNAVGKAARIRARPYVFANPGVLCSEWAQMTRKTATITFKTRQFKCKRLQSPIMEAWAMTVHKLQGGTFDEVMFNYKMELDEQLMYMGSSRVTSTHGLHLTSQFRLHVPSLERFQYSKDKCVPN